MISIILLVNLPNIIIILILMIKMSILRTSPSPHLRKSAQDANIVIIPIIMLLKVSIVNLLTTVLNDAPILPEEEAEGTGSIIR